jgi:hypothetical protein
LNDRSAGCGLGWSGSGALGAAAAAGGLGARDAAALALRDEVAALLDLPQDAIALDGLAEARDQVLWGFAFSKVYCCHERSISARKAGSLSGC